MRVPWLLALTLLSCAAPAAPPPAAPAAPPPAVPAGAPAFPGAEGWAASTPGGRGGRVIRVTTVDARGPGSLGAALGASGPRTVVFAVGGVIDLAGARVDVREPFLTVDGQTAPPPGITLIRGGLSIETHDVVIRHIRVRPGEAGSGKGSGWEIDAISTSTGAHDVIVDHCSTTWATDENLSASGHRFDGHTPDEWRQATSHRITFSNCIIAEGLSESTHGKGEHSKGSLIHDNVTDVAIIGNLYASNVERSPMFKGGARGIVVNNYIHNSGRTAIRYNLVANEWGEHPYQLGQMVVIGNVFTYGPNTPAGVPLVTVSGVGPLEIYLADNVARDAAGRDVPLLGGRSSGVVVTRAAPFWPAGLVPMPTSAVRHHVETDVGARPWDRDAVDARIVREALAGQGRVIDSEEDVEGYPAVR
jgi:pectate lyase